MNVNVRVKLVDRKISGVVGWGGSIEILQCNDFVLRTMYLPYH